MTPDQEGRTSTPDSHDRAQAASGELPAILGGWRSPPAKVLARLAALPIRAIATTRPVAVADPDALHPGDAPVVGDKLLLIFDGGCGICLHARDLFAVLDRRHRLTFDRIARHDGGLLADLTEDERYGSWHVIHPDGRAEHGSDGVAAAVGALPGGRWIERAIRRWPGPPDAGYRWFAENRGWISRGSDLINHPQRDPREQPANPRHDEVVDD